MVAPDAVSDATLPGQIVGDAGVTVSVGTVPTVVVTVTTVLQPFEPVTVNVCTPGVLIQTTEVVAPELQV